MFQAPALVLALALMLPGAASAQGVRGPAEAPPPGFEGEQYVDSRGCAYGRARINGQERWVPRLRADRTLLCGLTPSLAASRPAGAPEVTPRAAGTRAQPTRQARKTRPRTSAPPSVAPVAVDGGAFVRYEADIPTVRCPRRYRGRDIVCLEREVYDRLRVTIASHTLSIEDRGAAAAGAGHAARTGGRYVQVATFAMPSNAQNTIARLQARGLPVARSRLSHGGRAMQVVLAGPFGSPAALQDALGQARAMGFSDAFIR